MTSATNPYSAPQGDLLDDSQLTYGEVRFFSPSCRIGRVRYIAHAVVLMLAFGVLMAGIVAVGLGNLNNGGSMSMFSTIALSLAYLAYTVCIWILNIQRCHDLNKSGWFSLLLIIPAVNIFGALYLLFAPGTSGANEYGNRPPPNSKLHVALALFIPVLFFVGGIVAAISIPAYQDYAERAEQGALQQR